MDNGIWVSCVATSLADVTMGLGGSLQMIIDDPL